MSAGSKFYKDLFLRLSDIASSREALIIDNSHLSIIRASPCFTDEPSGRCYNKEASYESCGEANL